MAIDMLLVYTYTTGYWYLANVIAIVMLLIYTYTPGYCYVTNLLFISGRQSMLWQETDRWRLDEEKRRSGYIDQQANKYLESEWGFLKCQNVNCE